MRLSRGGLLRVSRLRAGDGSDCGPHGPLRAPRPRAASTSATPARRSSTRCSRAATAAASSCASTTPIPSARARSTPSRLRPTSSGSALRPTSSCGSRRASRSTMPQRKGCVPGAASIPATRAPTSSIASASASRRAGCRPSTTAPRSRSPPKIAKSSRPRVGGRTGAFCWSEPRSPGATWCAATATSTAPRSPTPCWCARTAPISTRCRRSSTTSTSASRM